MGNRHGIKIMTFNDLKFRDISNTHGEGACQAYVNLPNGLDVSVVRHTFSHGGEDGLYEIGVFGPDGNMMTIEEWGDQVKGWLTPEDIDKELEILQGLRPSGDLTGTVWEKLA